MKIAVTAQKDSLDSPFEPRFGRATGLVMFDTDSQAVSFMDNSANQNMPQGAGIQTAQMIADQGVQVLITGNIGPKASQALSYTSIEIYQFGGATVRKALDAYQKGLLQPLSLSGAQAGYPRGSAGPGRGMGRGMPGGGRGMGRGRGMRGGRGSGRGMGGCS